MCGIFGIVARNNKYEAADSLRVFEQIAKYSQDRGKDSSGVVFRDNTTRRIKILKGALPITNLLKSNEYKSTAQIIKSNRDHFEESMFVALGHARLVTNGSQLFDDNNQPILKNGTIVIHNGIIVNAEELWDENSELKKEFQIDTEIIADLYRKQVDKCNNVVLASRYALKTLNGTYSLALLTNNHDNLLLATNNGSLYFITDYSSFLVFASEKYFIERLTAHQSLKAFSMPSVIKPLPANCAISISLSEFNVRQFNLSENADNLPVKHTQPYNVDVCCIKSSENNTNLVIDAAIFCDRTNNISMASILEDNSAHIKKLRRCTKCILPETFPFIRFDAQGVCNYCNTYRPMTTGNDIDDLMRLVEPYRGDNKSSNCIVPFSGGRDSTYTLHIVKKVLGLNPIAFTYDWGMVTDLARRNIARVCGKLGVENIIVTADIKWKRENIRKNIEAWLRHPALGMIPLFMAGDKYFFYYCNKVRKRTGINLNIWGINKLENTEFKTGFAGVPPESNKSTIYSLSYINQIKLFRYIVKNVAINYKYINQSMIDSLGSYAVRYISPKRDYYHLFDYYRWDEDEIISLIDNEYNWERAIDTKSTWRIGDGTASFYNYIYLSVAGFTENDTFRSNQIREGMINREKAMGLIETDNYPRYETIRWYLEILGLDFAEVIKIINNIPKLYSN